MISGLVLNHLNGQGLVMTERYSAPCPASSRVCLTEPALERLVGKADGPCGYASDRLSVGFVCNIGQREAAPMDFQRGSFIRPRTTA
jgi:hypothetical protein